VRPEDEQINGESSKSVSVTPAVVRVMLVVEAVGCW
jgi:hypothetical protein